MFIEKLIIKGFKCFKDETEIKLGPFNGIIGNNGAGKTVILETLSRMFGSDIKYRRVKSSDFFLDLGESLEGKYKRELSIEVQIGFCDDDEDIPECFNQMITSSMGGTSYCRIRLDAIWENTNTPDGDIEERIYWITSSDKEIDDSDKKSLNMSDRSKIQVHYIPAARDPQKQMKHTSGTLLFQLLKNIQWSDDTLKNFEETNQFLSAIIQKEKGVETINKQLSNSWGKLFNDKIYKNVSISTTSRDLKSHLSKIEARFSPNQSGEVETQEKLSDGMKSLFYFSLITSVFELEEMLIENQEDHGFIVDSSIIPSLTVFAVEEPENHLSPHYFGKVMNAFRETTNSQRSQVILTSHSPAIVKRIDPTEIRYVLQNNYRVSCVKEIQLPNTKDESYKFVKEAVKAYPELYFSKLVILGEGDSEEVVIPKIAAAHGIDLDFSFVSIVPLGGRHVNHFWRLLKQLDIPYITLLDYDRERGGGDWGRIKYVLKQLIEIGNTKETILNTTSGVLSDEKFEKMHEWQINKIDDSCEKGWINFLKKYNIYFSHPYDIDFSLFKAFPAAFKTLDEGRGPNISIEINKIKEAIASVLKKDSSYITDISKYKVDNTYDIWFWYRYLFLGKGKPVSHINAFITIRNDEIIANAPTELKELVEKAKKLLEV